MNADAAQSGAGLDVGRLLSRGAAIPKAVLNVCLRCRLPVKGMWSAALATILAAAVLVTGAVTLSPWQRAPQEVTLELDEAAIFYSLPSFIAELKGGKARTHVIQLGLAIEMPASQQLRIAGQQSAIEETIKTRLRHFDRRELERNTGADRLRAEVLAIVNDAIAPAKALRVLYRQLVLD